MDSKASQTTSRTSRPLQEKGQGLVELVIVIPVLVIIVVGALDLGRIFFAVITVTNVSREGVRYLTLHPDDRRVVTTDPECSDLDIPVVPEPKPAYYCTEYAARQEAEVSALAPVVVDPSQITVRAYCNDGADDDAICDRRTNATVEAVYCFQPLILLFPFDEADPNNPCDDTKNEIQISRTTNMMVP